MDGHMDELMVVVAFDANFSKHQMKNPLRNDWKCSEYNVH